MFRDEFLKAVSPPLVPVDTPFGRVWIRTMTAGEKDEMEKQHGDDGKFRCRVLMLTCCSEDGRLLYSKRDLASLDELPLSAVEPIFDEVVKVNKMLAKDREMLRKNSQSPDGDSSSD
jgi:hypothetical protein